MTRDLILYTNLKNIKGYIISIDQEKAFDRVDRQFLYDVFKTMNFGPNFLRWVQVLYNESESCVLVNGYMTRFFKTTRGVRQGCSTSSEFYDMFEEPMVEHIRANEHIEGIPLPGTNTEALANLYADDNNYFIRKLKALFHLFHTFDKFEKATGAHVKPSKTKGLCLGGAKPFFEENIHIEWVNDSGLDMLGVTFFTDIEKTIAHNWTKVIDKLEQFTRRTKNRKLSLKGKALNLNMVGLGKFWYLATVFPLPPTQQKLAEDIIFQYFWSTLHDSTQQPLNSSPHTSQDSKRVNEPIARQTMYLPKDRGESAC